MKYNAAWLFPFELLHHCVVIWQIAHVYNIKHFHIRIDDGGGMTSVLSFFHLQQCTTCSCSLQCLWWYFWHSFGSCCSSLGTQADTQTVVPAGVWTKLWSRPPRSPCSTVHTAQRYSVYCHGVINSFKEAVMGESRFFFVKIIQTD